LYLTIQGSNKKKAKANVARQILLDLIGTAAYESLAGSSLVIHNCAGNPPPEMYQPEQIPEEKKEFFNEDTNASEYDYTFSDYICRYVIRSSMDQDIVYPSFEILSR
jgi:hypothetical protein